LIFCKTEAMPARELAGEVVEEIMNLPNRTLAAVLIAGGVSALAGPAQAVPLAGASLSLKDASTSDVQTVQWRGRWGGRGWGWGGVGFGLAAGALFGAALASPYRYGYYGYGYPVYSYSYGYPAYGYGYGYGYGNYGYGYPAYSYAYAPAYSYGYYGYPRVRYRAAFYRPWRGW
jgi:hypothetical protein